MRHLIAVLTLSAIAVINGQQCECPESKSNISNNMFNMYFRIVYIFFIKIYLLILIPCRLNNNKLL